jgi:hypothetical protein
MPNSSRFEEDSIEEILVSGIAIAKAFAGMEEEGQCDFCGSALRAKPQELRSEVPECPAEVFLTH